MARQDPGILLPVVAAQGVRDSHHGVLGGLVRLAQRLDGPDLDVRQARRNRALVQRHVHGGHGGAELVGRPVVAVHAVHGPHLEFRPLLVRQRDAGVVELAHAPVRPRDAHPGDVLAPLVGRDVLDRGRDQHVVVDARALHEARLLAADLQQHAQAMRRVLLVSEVVGADHLLVADELLRPVALLAGLARGAQIVDRRRNGPRVAVHRDGPDLPQAVDLGLDEPVGALADVALDAGHAGVGGDLVGGPLRMHDAVAELAAEARGLRRLVGPVAAESEQQEHERARDQHAERGVEVLALGQIELEMDVPGALLRLAPHAVAPVEEPQRNQRDAEQEDRGEEQIERAQVRSGLDHHLQGEEEHAAEQSAQRQCDSHQQQPVAPVLLVRGLVRLVHVRFLALRPVLERLACRRRKRLPVNRSVGCEGSGSPRRGTGEGGCLERARVYNTRRGRAAGAGVRLRGRCARSRSLRSPGSR